MKKSSFLEPSQNKDNWEIKPKEFLCLTCDPPRRKCEEEKVLIYIKSPVILSPPFIIWLERENKAEKDYMYPQSRIHRHSPTEILLLDGLFAFDSFKKMLQEKQKAQEESTEIFCLHVQDSKEKGCCCHVSVDFLPVEVQQLNDCDTAVDQYKHNPKQKEILFNKIPSFEVLRQKWVDREFDFSPLMEKELRRLLQLESDTKKLDLVQALFETAWIQHMEDKKERRQIDPADEEQKNSVVHFRDAISPWALVPEQIIVDIAPLILCVYTPPLKPPLTIWLSDQKKGHFQDTFYWKGCVYINDLTETVVWKEFKENSKHSETFPLYIIDSNNLGNTFFLTIQKDSHEKNGCAEEASLSSD